MAVPYTFGSATTSIPLSQLDSNFATTITLGNTAIQLGNTVTTLNNMTLANVTISSGTSNLATTAITNGTSNVTIASSGGNIAMATNGTTAVTIDTSQNVGIGTTSPSYRIDAVGTGTASTGIIRTSSNFTNSTTKYGYYTVGHYTNANAPFGFIQGESNSTDNNVHIGGGAGEVTAATRIDFYTAANNTTVTGTERMRIDSSGNLLVGQTAQTGSEKLGVTQSGATSATGYFYATAGNYSNAVITARCARGSATTEYNFLECNQVSTLQLVIRANGNVVNTNNSYGSLSDVKLKENIEDATPKLADLMQVKVRNYNLKSDPTHKQLGVIAQELEQVFPAMVEETPDRDIDGNDLGTTTKSVKYSVFVPMLIKAMQEQAETINALTARIVALEAK